MKNVILGLLLYFLLTLSASAQYLQSANNLSDVASISTSRSNLGLGTAAVQNIGTSGGTVPLLNGANIWTGLQTVQNISLPYNLELSDSSNGINLQAGCGTGGIATGCSYNYGGTTAARVVQVCSIDGCAPDYYGTHEATALPISQTSTYISQVQKTFRASIPSATSMTVTGTPSSPLAVGDGVVCNIAYGQNVFGYITSIPAGGGAGAYTLAGNTLTNTAHNCNVISNQTAEGQEEAIAINQHIVTGGEVANGTGSMVGLLSSQMIESSGGTNWNSALDAVENSGWVNQQHFGMEIDNTDNSGCDASVGGPCLNVGLWINMGGNTTNTFGIYISPNAASVDAYNDGIGCLGTNVVRNACFLASTTGDGFYGYDSTGDTSSAAYHDAGMAPTGLLLQGTYSNAAIDTTTAATTSGLDVASGQTVCFDATKVCLKWNGSHLVGTDASGTSHTIY